jgi:hypothetical protein
MRHMYGHRLLADLQALACMFTCMGMCLDIAMLQTCLHAGIIGSRQFLELSALHVYSESAGPCGLLVNAQC